MLLLARLNHHVWSDDEAVLVLTAQAVRQGARLYDEVWFNYPPGFVQLLNASFALGGFSLATARVAVFCCGFLTLLFVAATARALGSAWSGVFALLTLATAPHFVALSSMAMAEIPAVGAATLVMLAALFYHRRGQRRWLIVSGLAFATSLWFKPTTIPTAIAPLVAVWLTQGTTKGRVGDGALFASVTALTVIIGMLFHDLPSFAHQFGRSYLRSKAAFDLDLLANIRNLRRYFLRDKYLLSHVSLVALCVYGWRALWHSRRTEAILFGTWPVIVGITLLFHAPLYRHHLIQLLPPVTILAGLGLERAFVTLRAHPRSIRLVFPYVLLAITGVELATGIWVDIVSLPLFEEENVELGVRAVQRVEGVTHPGEYVITDGHFIALLAERPVPPELTNTSRMRIKTGQLTDQQVIDIARRVQPGAIVFWEKKLDSLDDFATWVTCHYDLSVAFDERHRIYRSRRVLTAEDVATPLVVEFGQNIRLLGYSMTSKAVEVDGTIDMVLYWEALGRPEHDYKVFVHLLDRQGEIVGQDDSTPRRGQCPTWVWQPGEIIHDPHSLLVDWLGSGGPYRILVGLYDAHTGQRPPPDHVLLTTIPVVRSLR